MQNLSTDPAVAFDRRKRVFRRVYLPCFFFIVSITSLSGCSGWGSRRLDHDQVDYSRALSTAAKRQALSNIVGLRYADAPSFLQVSQVIAAYTFDVSGSFLGIGAASNATGNSGQLGAMVGYSNHPTFTFTPTSGEEFAAAYIRPLTPSLVLPLAQSGAPIDVLFRLAVQSINGLQNSSALAGTDSAGTPGFFELIHALRRLQIAGAMSIRFVKQGDADHVFLSLDVASGAPGSLADDAKRVRELLGLTSTASDIEILSGTKTNSGNTVAILTRSVLDILSEIGGQIDVPDGDVKAHATLPTVHVVGVETRPVIIIRVGNKIPKDVFVAIDYETKFFWIEQNDFDSKFAFSLLQNLIALSQTAQNVKAPVVTIPAS